MKTHDCYKCKFREKIVGNAHSRCAAEQVKNGVKITSTYAISNGWANHPSNFDPIWIDKCKMFEGKEL
jgi:hypothetical protein